MRRVVSNYCCIIMSYKKNFTLNIIQMPALA